MIPTEVPMINVALSGRLDGGLVPAARLAVGTVPAGVHPDRRP